MARLYADEDFHYRVVEILRLLGHDVVTVQEAGNCGQKDFEVLAFATVNRRAVLAFNRRHFVRLHKQVQLHAGIIVCTRDIDVAALASRIDNSILNYLSLDNQLIRVVRPPKP